MIIKIVSVRVSLEDDLNPQCLLSTDAPISVHFPLGQLSYSSVLELLEYCTRSSWHWDCHFGPLLLAADQKIIPGDLGWGAQIINTIPLFVKGGTLTFQWKNKLQSGNKRMNRMPHKLLYTLILPVIHNPSKVSWLSVIRFFSSAVNPSLFSQLCPIHLNIPRSLFATTK